MRDMPTRDMPTRDRARHEGGPENRQIGAAASGVADPLGHRDADRSNDEKNEQFLHGIPFERQAFQA